MVSYDWLEKTREWSCYQAWQQLNLKCCIYTKGRTPCFQLSLPIMAHNFLWTGKGGDFFLVALYLYISWNGDPILSMEAFHINDRFQKLGSLVDGSPFCKHHLQWRNCWLETYTSFMLLKSGYQNEILVIRTISDFVCWCRIYLKLNWN